MANRKPITSSATARSSGCSHADPAHASLAFDSDYTFDGIDIQLLEPLWANHSRNAALPSRQQNLGFGRGQQIKAQAHQEACKIFADKA